MKRGQRGCLKGRLCVWRFAGAGGALRATAIVAIGFGLLAGRLEASGASVSDPVATLTVQWEYRQFEPGLRFVLTALQPGATSGSREVLRTWTLDALAGEAVSGATRRLRVVHPMRAPAGAAIRYVLEAETTSGLRTELASAVRAARDPGGRVLSFGELLRLRSTARLEPAPAGPSGSTLVRRLMDVAGRSSLGTGARPATRIASSIDSPDERALHEAAARPSSPTPASAPFGAAGVLLETLLTKELAPPS